MSKNRRRAPAGCYWRDGVLWGKIEIKGRQIRWSLRTDDGALAARRRAARRALELGAAHFGEIRRTYEQAFTDWGHWIADQVAPNTVKRYATSLKQLGPHLTPLYLDEITAGKIGEIIQIRKTSGASVATIRRDLSALSSLLGFAEVQGWRDDNPALAWQRRLRERREPIVLPDAADVARVIEAAPGMLADLVRVAIATGCRLDELAAAKRAQFNAERRELTIYGKGRKGKGKKLRAIDLEPFGAFALIDRLPAFLNSQWLFWHGEGEPYRNASSNFAALTNRIARAIAKRAKAGEAVAFRRFKFHDLRHLHAVQWLRAGRSIYDLKERLGHSSIKTTEIYLEHIPAEQRRIVQHARTESAQ